MHNVFRNTGKWFSHIEWSFGTFHVYGWAIGHKFAGIAASAFTKNVPASENISDWGSKARTKRLQRLRSRSTFNLNVTFMQCTLNVTFNLHEPFSLSVSERFHSPLYIFHGRLAPGLSSFLILFTIYIHDHLAEIEKDAYVSANADHQ